MLEDGVLLERHALWSVVVAADADVWVKDRGRNDVVSAQDVESGRDKGQCCLAQIGGGHLDRHYLAGGRCLTNTRPSTPLKPSRVSFGVSTSWASVSLKLLKRLASEGWVDCQALLLDNLPYPCISTKMRRRQVPDMPGPSRNVLPE
jgi:hypothetical protein